MTVVAEEADLAARLRGLGWERFKPKVAATVLYLKVAIRQSCIVVSLHEDEENGND